MTAGIPAIPPVEEQGYTVKAGDLDGDGDIDIYVRRVAGTAWNLPLPEFVLRHNSDGTFAVETTISAQSRYVINQWPVSSSILPQLVDFNADGYQDVLLTGLSPANAGSSDLVVFASNGPGAPAATARLLDDTVRNFVLDTAGHLVDNSYFNAAVAYRCTTSFYSIYVPYWTIDGYQAYSYFPVPFPVCQLVVNSAYSSAALTIAGNVAHVRDTGILQHSSADGDAIASAFQQVLGVPFMGGVLQNSSLVAADYLVPSWDAQGLDIARARRLAGALLDMLKYFTNQQAPAEDHHFELHTKICNSISNGSCTLANVYHRMLQVPVTGRAESACGPGWPVTLCSQEVPPNTIVHVYAEDLTGAGYGGDVLVTQQANYCYTNTTQPGHVFYPGTVTRCAYYNNDDIWISTIGEGQGEFKKLNEAMGPVIFTGIDVSIIARMLAQGMGVILPPS